MVVFLECVLLKMKPTTKGSKVGKISSIGIRKTKIKTLPEALQVVPTPFLPLYLPSMPQELSFDIILMRFGPNNRHENQF